MAKVPKVSGSFSFGLFTSGLSLSVGGSKNEIIGSKKLVLKGGGGDEKGGWGIARRKRYPWKSHSRNSSLILSLIFLSSSFFLFALSLYLSFSSVFLFICLPFPFFPLASLYLSFSSVFLFICLPFPILFCL